MKCLREKFVQAGLGFIHIMKYRNGQNVKEIYNLCAYHWMNIQQWLKCWKEWVSRKILQLKSGKWVQGDLTICWATPEMNWRPRVQSIRGQDSQSSLLPQLTLGSENVFWVEFFFQVLLDATNIPNDIIYVFLFFSRLEWNAWFKVCWSILGLSLSCIYMQ